MPAYNVQTIQDYFAAADAAATKSAKGKALEDLSIYLFTLIPGIAIGERNKMNAFDTEEIDVAFWNEQEPDGLKSFRETILVECKNWSSRVGSEEVAWFLKKIEDRGERFGILIAANGITGSAKDSNRAHQMVTLALPKRIRMIVITRTEILKLTSSEDLVRMMKQKVCQLIASGTVWP